MAAPRTIARQVFASQMPRGQALIAELIREPGINPKSVAKWRKCQTVEDRKTGSKAPRSAVLSEVEEAMVIAF